MFKMLKRSISTLTASAFVLGFLAIAPNTLAASTEFYNTPDTQFDYDQESMIDFEVEMLGNSGMETPVVFKITGPLYENDEQTQIIDTKWYDGNETLSFNWNGRFNGEYVDSGEYRAVFEGADNTLTHKFYVTGDGNDDDDDYDNDDYDNPTLEFNPSPDSTYDEDDGDYKVSVRLMDADNPTEVTVDVYDADDNDLLTTEQYAYANNTTHTFYLDLGEYDNVDTFKLRIEGQDDDGDDTNVLTRMVIVEDSSNDSNGDSDSWLTFNPKPASTYDADEGNYKVAVKLADYDRNTRVYVYVKNKQSSQYTQVDDFNYTQAGTHTFYWDGRLNGSRVKDGDYQLRIYGRDSNGDETNVITHTFEVDNDSDDDDDDNDSNCAGFEDVRASDKNCDAIEWVQKNGIMTGQGSNDYFDPNGIVNRAQMAKIATMAYDEFEEGEDYCDGDNPFPDVKTNEWYSEHICLAADLDMITGYKAGPEAGRYAPNKSVSILEMFAIVLRPLDENMRYGASYIGLDFDEWYTPFAVYAKDHDLYPGSSLNPEKLSTRREVAQFLYELYLNDKLSN